MSKQKDERIRRLIFGDILRVLRHRYGPTLPDDDAGRDDLNLLLLPVSLDPKNPVEKMTAQIETLADWMPAAEAKDMIDSLINLPLWYRKPSAKEMGERLQLTNAERERLKVWRIAPVDMTAEELVEQRKGKDRARKQKRYKRSRADYIAKSKSKLKPWQSEGISRTTWYERRRTSQSAIRVYIGEDSLVRTAEGPAVGALGEDTDRPEANGRTKPKECQLLCTAD